MKIISNKISWKDDRDHLRILLRFEVSTVMTMKRAMFWDVTPCGSCRFLQEPHGVTSQKTAFFTRGSCALGDRSSFFNISFK
jgi:hypothetical protein